jgi:hypothetical protein
MKIADGIKIGGTKGHKVVEIPDCSRDDLPEFFKSLGFKVGVEIGVFTAGYTEILAKSGLTIYGVDPWLAYDDYPYYSEPQKQWRCDKQYEESKQKVAPYPNCTLIRKTSMDAAEDFEDNSIDFVYIDGNHSFKYVAEDICEWVKKVKPGGFVCGHDYIYARPTNFHVHHVVDAYVEAFGIKTLWILGRKNPLEGEKRDKWRSWMFRKHDERDVK